jgi:hypothetical protein
MKKRPWKSRGTEKRRNPRSIVPAITRYPLPGRKNPNASRDASSPRPRLQKRKGGAE